MDIGQHIKLQRQSLGLSQSQVAKSLHVTPQFISAIETNKRIPTINFAVELASKLNTSLNYLVYGKEANDIDIFGAIAADKSLTPNIKKALIEIIKAVLSNNISE